jgi:two-component system phosphate regulon sensor histidine kinase PhoR
VTPELVALVVGIVIGVVLSVGAVAWRGRTIAAQRRRPAGESAGDATGTQRVNPDELVRMADLAGMAVLQLDDELVVRAASAPAGEMLHRGSLVGLSAIEAFADHRAEQLVAAARRDGAAEGELSLRDDPAARVLLRARRSPDDGVLVALEDRSELRRLQQVRTDFVDNVSHELRTPLTNMRLLVETLGLELEGERVEPAIRERVAAIDRETAHLVELVNDLLDLSRLEQRADQLKLETLEIGPVVASALDRIRPFAERQQVVLRNEVSADLPRVRGDAARLGQLLLNLLHNAVKFSPPGSSVMLSSRPEGSAVVISVTDSGTGIPRADLERIFERFYKVDRARTRSAGGTGLGLAIARHIAEAHGGRIWAESEEGRGSTFSFSLPAAGGTPAAG